MGSSKNVIASSEAIPIIGLEMRLLHPDTTDDIGIRNDKPHF